MAIVFNNHMTHFIYGLANENFKEFTKIDIQIVLSWIVQLLQVYHLRLSETLNQTPCSYSFR